MKGCGSGLPLGQLLNDGSRGGVEQSGCIVDVAKPEVFTFAVLQDDDQFIARDGIFLLPNSEGAVELQRFVKTLFVELVQLGFGQRAVRFAKRLLLPCYGRGALVP